MLDDPGADPAAAQLRVHPGADEIHRQRVDGPVKQVRLHAVAAQDETPGNVSESKKKVAAEFHISREQLDLIEKEGVDKDWPPLDS